jgi:hypothetical protein
VLVRADGVDYGESVHDRHLQIEKNNIWRGLADKIKSVAAIRRFSHIIAACLEYLSLQLAAGSVIIGGLSCHGC